MKKPCFNVIFEDENITIPEVEDFDLLYFGLVFMKIYERKLQEKQPELKFLNF